MKSRKSRVAVAALVLLVVVAGGYLTMMRKPVSKVAVPGAVLTLPQTTVNLPNGHLLQVTVAVQLEAGVSPHGFKPDAIPRMENAEILVLSRFGYTQLLSATGKDAARSALLGDLRQIVGHGPVGPAVMDVYFTTFVMQ